MIKPIGNEHSKCPYCNFVLAKRPQAKTKCTNCKNPIYSRIRPFDEQKVLLTENDAEQVEIQWATINGILENYLKEKQDKESIRQYLRKKLGREPLKKEIQTEYLKYILPERRRAILELYRQNRDIIIGVQILAAKASACENCLKHNREIYSLDNVPDLPIDKCTSHYGYCRCTYISVLKRSKK